MVKFMLKCFLLVFVLFFGVLFGMQQANDGMKKMKGYNDPQLYSAFQVKEGKSGTEASVLGQKVTSHDLEQKKKQLEEMKAFNMFSSIGKKISDVVTNLFSEITNKLFN
ncbi:YqxA family protein [Peribacillus tepidiphilus]|uniref:YqxA family protein n=1 Tax=Peribacillus tepidiphilus TaxID=2652445 RepID=UPI0012916643|nr:YqxA family protein [Peribacillus tepidiphilus]